MHWESKTVTYETNLGMFGPKKVDTDRLDQQLNQMGAAGWELATAFSRVTGGNGLILKRRKEDDK